MTSLKGKDILRAKTLSKEEIDLIISRAEELMPYAKKEKVGKQLEGKLLAALFYEPSTRTRLSFETAFQRLGGRVITVSGIESSSMVKGETLEDTARVVENFADVIAVRHPQAGSAKQMADVINIPVINAGDGPADHPSQSLLDLLTIKQLKGKIGGLKIAFVGDLKYGRTVHSLSELLVHFKVELLFVSPKQLAVPEDLKTYLKEKGIKFTESEELDDALKADVLYMTRIQKERFASEAEYMKFRGVYVLTKKLIDESGNKDLVVLHPLPRVDEITTDVDDFAGAAYFKQVQNGVAVRMALLTLVLGM